ncbi:MAG: heavy metal translocating P-type ATPase [Peptoniphilus sp.]|nr:heavy metal translocating P-type ATPase [Peptoniphilus sp.]
MLKIRGLDCPICTEDLKEHRKQVGGLKTLSKDFDLLNIEKKDDVDSDELLENIRDHLKHVGHDHDISYVEVDEYYLKDLTCGDCTAKIISNIKKIQGVEDANFNFAIGKLSVQHDLNLNSEVLFKDIRKIVDRIEPGLEITSRDLRIKRNIFQENKGEILKLSAVFIALVAMMVLTLPAAVEFTVLLLLYLIVAKDVLKTAFDNIRAGEIFDENFLMSIASIGAIIIGEAPEAVAVMLFYEIGEFFEDLAVESSRDSIRNALNLKAEYTNLLKDGKVLQVDPKVAEVGDVILVRPGEKIPLDGEIVKGDGFIDTSNITGESMPLYVSEGDYVNSGCINKSALLHVKVGKVYEDGTVAKIINLVENASSRKAKSERIITKFARVYTPTVVALSVLIVVISQMFNLLSPRDAVFRALTFLVISCPCAFVLSVPLSVFAGIGAASKRAIFVKGGNFLESLAKVKHIFMDKTGTITKGVFEVVDVIAKEEDRTQLLKYAYLAEKNSTHPIAKSIVNYTKSYEFEGEVQDLQEVPGKGVIYFQDGNKIYVGNKSLLETGGVEFEDLNSPGVQVHVAVDKRYLGALILKDAVKDSVKESIQELKNRGIKITLLSGDLEDNVKAAALEVGIDDYYGRLLPQDKVEKLEEATEKKDGLVAFVGDGVNDAPVLARADIGISMGDLGSDSAVEASDIVLLTDDISKIVEGIDISEHTRKIVIQNIAFALGIKIVFLILGSLGMIGMWAAVFADVGVTLIAVLNSMRALNYHKSSKDLKV